MDPIVLHRNDTNPSLYFRVWDQDNEQYLDLTDADCSVIAKFREKGTTTIIFTATCVKVSPSMGLVRMDWPAGALTNLASGRYEIEVSVCPTASTVQTANRYYMCGSPDNDANTLQLRIKEDF